MLDKIKQTLAEQLGIKENDIKLESRILEDLGADSLDVVELLMLLEDEFGVEIAEEDAINLKTVQDIINAIESKK